MCSPPGHEVSLSCAEQQNGRPGVIRTPGRPTGVYLSRTPAVLRAAGAAAPVEVPGSASVLSPVSASGPASRRGGAAVITVTTEAVSGGAVTGGTGPGGTIGVPSRGAALTATAAGMARRVWPARGDGGRVCDQGGRGNRGTRLRDVPHHLVPGA